MITQGQVHFPVTPLFDRAHISVSTQRFVFIPHGPLI